MRKRIIKWIIIVIITIVYLQGMHKGVLAKKQAYEDEITAANDTKTEYSDEKTELIVNFNANGGIIKVRDGNDWNYVTTYQYKIEKGEYFSFAEMYNDIEKDNYVFFGWEDQNGNIYEEFEELFFEEDFYLTAIWKTEVTVSYHANGGAIRLSCGDETCVTEYQFKYINGNSVSLGNTEIYEIFREGYLLSGWMDQDGNMYSEYEQVTVTDNTVFTAIWVESIIITWDANGGKITDFDYDNYEYIEVSTAKEEVEKGSNINLYNIKYGIDRDGFVLVGWEDQNGTIYYLGDDCYLEEDITLTAIWEGAIYITLDANGGQIIDYGEEDYVYLSTYQLKERKGNTIYLGEVALGISREGFVLTGWEDQNGNQYFAYGEVIVENDLTLTAIWSNAITVTLDGNGGEVYNSEESNEDTAVYTSECQIKVGKGQTIRPSQLVYDDIKREGYLLVGWEDSDGFVYGKDDRITVEEDMTFVAIWGEELSVIWDGNGGEFITWNGREDSITEAYGSGETVILYQDIQRDGYMLTGWEDQNGKKWDKGERIILEKNMTFSAVWEESVSITWKGNGGYLKGIDSSCTEDTVLRKKNSHLDYIPGFVHTDDHMALLGYSKDPDGESGILTVLDLLRDFIPNEDTTFYAIWRPGYRITFDLNGSTFFDSERSTINTEVVPAGNQISCHYGYEELDGKVMLGWTTVKNDENTILLRSFGWDEYVACEDITLYAFWADACTVTWDGNGGYLSFRDEYIDVYEEVAAVNHELNHSWYFNNYDENLAILGWSATKDVKDIVLYTERKKDYLITGDITLYAIWVPKIQLSLDGNGRKIWANNTEENYSFDFPKGELLTSDIYDFPQADEEDVEFLGWSTSRDVKDMVKKVGEDGYRVTEDITLYAIWSDQLQEPEIPAITWEFTLPTGTRVIEAEAFRGIKAKTVYIPDGCETIGALAFADSSITAIYIPLSVKSIAADSLPDGITIYTPKGSEIEQWTDGKYEVREIQ